MASSSAFSPNHSKALFNISLPTVTPAFSLSPVINSTPTSRSELAPDTIVPESARVFPGVAPTPAIEVHQQLPKLHPLQPFYCLFLADFWQSLITLLYSR